jgi:hypothetical protein
MDHVKAQMADDKEVHNRKRIRRYTQTFAV